MPFTIIRGDITTLRTDAIVNAANELLAPGGGVCGAIHAAAGAKLAQECRALGGCPTGQAKITSGYNLPAKYVIHAVGPVWRGKAEDEKLLYSCYESALRLAKENGCNSIAFPLISSGIFGCPKRIALETAQRAIRDFLENDDMNVTLVLFDKSAMQLADELGEKVKQYIDDHYAAEHDDMAYRRESGNRSAFFAARAIMPDDVEMCAMAAPAEAPKAATSLAQALSELDLSFSQKLLKLIDESGQTDAQVYKRANIDRKLFSKIRTDPNYRPKKQTVLAFAIALRLSLPDTEELLKSAGFALSHSNKADVIVEFFIASGRYDIYEINDALFAYDQQLIGG